MDNIEPPTASDVAKMLQVAVNQLQQGQSHAAENMLRSLLRVAPGIADAHHLLGVAALLQQRYQDAYAAIGDAIRLQPHAAMYHNNFGIAAQNLNDIELAIQSFRTAIQLQPDLEDAHRNLGNACFGQRQLEQAAASYKRAIALNTRHVDVYNNLGIALHRLGHLEEALDIYRRAESMASGMPEIHCNLGALYCDMSNRLDEAMEACRRAIALRHDYAEAHYNLGNALVAAGLMKQARQSYQNAMSHRPGYEKAFSNLLFILNYLPDVTPQTIHEQHKRYDEIIQSNRLADLSCNIPDWKEGERLRVGYVSGDFCAHSVAYFIEPLLEAHDRDAFEVFCFSNVETPDEVTARLKSKADHWLSILGVDDDSVAKQIRNLGIHILVDLSGHTHGNRLPVFARRPSPIQATWLGYPNTTGLAAVDYRITDAITDPPGVSDHLHTETLVRLSDGFLCYRAPRVESRVTQPPVLKTGHITFGCFNNIAKVTPEVIAVWSTIMRAAHGARIILKYKSFSDNSVRKRFLRLFAEQGIAADRIELHSKLPRIKDHLDLYQQVDIGLDPFPYNGTTTTFEALWMGVPVIVMEGDRHAARVGASILRHLGFNDWIASTPCDYIANAVALAEDTTLLSSIRRDLRAQLESSKFCDSADFAQRMESAYRMMWERAKQRRGRP